MKPLQSIAMGFVIIALVAPLAGYDALPDPLGWVLVVLGLRTLPAGVAQQVPLVVLATLAGAVSLAVWFPAVGGAVLEADRSLGWALNLPQLAFSAALCHVLARAAGTDGDRSASAWLRITRLVVVVVGVLPVLVFGAGLDGLESGSYLAAGGSLLLLIWLLFSYASRPWARNTIGQSPTKSGSVS